MAALCDEAFAIVQVCHKLIWFTYVGIFTDLAVYVDREGMRSRKEELLWHSIPLSICKQFFLH